MYKAELISSTELVKKFGRKSADVKRAIRQGYKKDPVTYHYEETREKAGNGKMSVVYLVKPKLENLLFKKVRWTKKMVESWLETHNSTFILISEKFTNIRETHLWKCGVCGKIHPKSFNSIKGSKNKKGIDCDKCSGYEKQTIPILTERMN